ncbi:hypothetical protein GW17_00029419 [Ensete ventricosum]|uniref:Uncharacterized protein n=1 Tax=Ensete ventricosum TaxID=4639 RepID=A0A444EA06_ENSVE|nr:hypothetical protein B296_00034334 [Ensete ventricosum]RWW07208.1 hypothetical protein GW17_00029419 [Ensete ventricosum]
MHAPPKGKHQAELSTPKSVNYCLWVAAEVAVVAADIPEGVSIGAVLLRGPLAVRKLELSISILVFVMAACYLGELSYANPPGNPGDEGALCAQAWRRWCRQRRHRSPRRPRHAVSSSSISSPHERSSVIASLLHRSGLAEHVLLMQAQFVLAFSSGAVEKDSTFRRRNQRKSDANDSISVENRCLNLRN